MSCLKTHKHSYAYIYVYVYTHTDTNFYITQNNILKHYFYGN